MPPGLLRGVLALLVLAAALVALAPALDGGLVLWDDPSRFLVETGWRGTSPGRLEWMATTRALGTYEPLAWLSHAIEHALWGTDFHAYRRTSWLLHGLGSALLFLVLGSILRRAFDAPSGPRVDLAAAAGALLFAVHPLRAEPIAWLSARGYPLALLFLLLSTAAHLGSTSPASRARRLALGALSVGLFLLAMLSKPVAAGFPIALAALDVAAFRRRASRALLGKVPHLLVALPVLAYAFGAKAETSLVAFTGSALLARLVLPVHAFVFYLARTILPGGLSPTYPLDPALFDPALPLLERLEPRHLVSAIVALGLVAEAWRARRRRPWLLAALVAYAALLAPVSGVAQSGNQEAADRYAHLATLPWVVLAGAGAYAWARRAAPRRLALAGLAAALLLAAYGVAAHRQAGFWRDSRTLWTRAVEVDPADYLAQAQLGFLALEEDRPEEALGRYHLAIQANPRYAIAWRGRGRARERLGDLEAALADYDVAIDLAPDIARSHYFRGRLLARRGDTPGALRDLTRAIELDPGAAEPWSKRGALLLLEGDLYGAIRDLRRARELDPGDETTRLLLEAALEAKAGAGD